MKPITSLLVLSLAIGLTFAYKDLFKATPAYAYGNYLIGCLYKGVIIQFNETIRYAIKNRYGCESYFCREDLVIEKEVCGPYYHKENATCRIESDLSKLYPYCCPKLVCYYDN